jgi:hypothetical protein
MTQTKTKKKVSNVMLVVTCTMIILYAAANFALQYFAGVEVSPTLTTAWFAFWGSEAGFLTCIKISKVLKGTDSPCVESLPNNEYID